MKLIKGLFKFILILLLLVIIGVGVLAYMVYDSTEVSTDYTENANDLDYEVNSTVSYALKDTKSTNIIDATLTEEGVNELLGSVVKSINETLVSQTGGTTELSGILVTIGADNKMKASVYAKASFFKTSVSGGLSIVDDKENNEIYFQINDASLGKLTAGKELIATILSKAISENDIETELAEKGITVTVDISNLRITMKKENLEDMILKLFKDDSNVGLYSALVAIIFDNDLINIIASDGVIGAKIDTEKLSYDESTMYALPYDFNSSYEDLKTKLELLLNSSIITYKQAQTMFNYLVQGYDKVKESDDNIEDGSERQYDYIYDLDLSSIGISNPKTYEGILTSPGSTMEDIIASQVPTSITDLLTYDGGIKINESAMNDILFSCGVAGLSYCFPRMEDNNWKVSYFYIESMYVKMLNDKMLLMVTLNINGKQLGLQIKLDVNGSNGLQLNTQITDVLFGEIGLDEKTVQSLLTFIGTATEGESWFKVDADNKAIVFDFSKIFADNEMLTYCINHSTSTTVKVVGDNTTGYISIKIGLALLP